MKIFETVAKLVETETAVLCNKCGNSCELDWNTGGCSVIVEGYYDSKYLEDGVCLTFDICEKCIKEFMDGFLLPAEKV